MEEDEQEALISFWSIGWICEFLTVRVNWVVIFQVLSQNKAELEWKLGFRGDMNTLLEEDWL